MVTAIFNPDTTMTNTYGLWQWDYGQVLRIQGLNLPSMVEIHFSLQETGGTAVMRVGVTKDGVTDVVIPDSMLQNDGAASDYDIFVFVYLTDDTSGQTEYKIKLRVKSRPEPEVPSGGEEPDIFHEAVQKVKESADKAAESERQAEGWAHGREDLPERAQDNAKYYAGQAAADAKKTGTDRKEVERLVESASGIDEQVVKVENLTKQAQTSATNAALSEQAAKTAETNAQNAQAGAETAEGNAELAERNAKASEQAVEKAKQLVTQMGQEVLDNKNHVDQTAQAFALTAQQAVADVNKAGQTQTEQVLSVGESAVESVKTAQDTATQAVEIAKTEAVKSVQTEGTTQTGNVTAEGTKQVQAVQQAAQEIVADREQIAQNKADVTTLKEDIKNMDCIIFNDLIHKLSFKPEGTSNNISLEENTIISDGAIASQYKAFVNETLFENNKKYRIVAKFKNTDSKILRIYLNEFTYSYGVSFGHAPGINPKETYTSIVDYDCASTDVRGFSIYCLEESASYAVDIYVYDITDCKYCNNFDFLKGGKTIKILKKDLEKPFFGKVALTYGDSITEQATWQGYLKNELGFTKIINKGVGGRRLIEMATDKALATITEDFDIMLVMGGTNDWAQDRKIGNPTDELTDEVSGFDSTLYGGLNTLIKKLTTKYLDKRIVFITQIPTKHSSGEAFFLKGGSADGVKNSNGDTTADFANATIVACKNNHVPYIDLNCLVGWNKNNIAVYIKNENNAFFHPNDIGGKRIAECISGCLSQIKFI